MGKTENEIVAQSEESITLVTSCRLPHYSDRSFTVVQDDILLFPVILNGGVRMLCEKDRKRNSDTE